MIQKFALAVALLFATAMAVSAQPTSPQADSRGSRTATESPDPVITPNPIPGEGLNRESDQTSTRSKRFSFGILAGANQTSSVSASVLQETESILVRHEPAGWLVGGLFETHLNARFSVSAGLSYVPANMWQHFFYRRDAFDPPLDPLGPNLPAGWKETEEWWTVEWPEPNGYLELPVTLNYRLGNRKWHPVIGVGAAFRGSTNSDAPYGAVALFGIEVSASRRWTVAPQVRYFRWADPRHASPWSGPRNQVQALVAVTF